MNDKYLLKGHKPVPVEDLVEWARWYETANRRVAETVLGDVRVSTVFLALDHRMRDQDPPLLFETMIFGGPQAGYCERYSTWEEAEEGHAQAVELARGTVH